MPIRFKCPHCQKPLSVKEHLAGKKAACPACKKAIKIPTPVAAAADVDDLAVSALSDAPKTASAAPVPPKTITFTCVFCDETAQVSVELAGKQTPCPNPECGRIIKVPLLKEEKAKDWRTVNTQGPSAALRRGEEEPEGAWGTATSRGRVSMGSLVEADAIPVQREKLTVMQWVKRGLLATSIVAVIVLAWTGIRAYQTQGVQKQALAKALEALGPSSKLSPPLRAELHRAAGEYYTQANEPAKALEHFQNARDAFTNAGPKDANLASERDLFLIELAVALVALGGGEDEVRSKTRLEWSDVQKEIVRTVTAIARVETRIIAVREVANRLLKGPKELAANLAVQVGAASEKKSVRKTPEGEEVTEYLSSQVDSQQIALFLALDDTERATGIRPMPSEKDAKVDLVARLGHAEGKARQGNYDEARRLAQLKGSAEHRLEASLAVALIALADGKTDEARANTEAALALESELRRNNQPIAPTLRWQLARAAVHAGLADQAKPVIDAITVKATRSRAQLELALADLHASRELVALSTIETHVKDKDSLAFARGIEAVSRTNSRRGFRRDMIDALESTEERHHPFVHIGIGLGVQDAGK
jgi:tetratricopeptide (TPR) repeat protein